ncbi:tandem-95 repeat protein [Paenibacillus psychroresistens]|uniref:Tandem-95 repeat protein n=1 Tax=Paenibacillus psychroresistens TaxID=1778678 RepID=A0A6B8RRC9_9BACL|nr:tandem-95 repeat protein [Paenibacillus psychroresistens]QGQ97946.1 tandem-95 repeat protein [Paenibacillus psychroresistens]
MKKYAGLFLLFASLALILLNIGTKTSFAANTVLSDDFSTSTGSKWTRIGINNTPTYATDGTMRLTSSGQGQVGTIWLDQNQLSAPILPPYTVTFRFLINEADSTNVGADGIVFMFNKQQNSTPVSGGGMGFQTGNGYGIEFDTYSNAFDPSYNHISLFKSNPDHSAIGTPYLAQVQDNTFENAQWHNVKINVGTGNVKVYLDNNLKLNWSGTLDSTYNGIGLTASTGYYYNKQSIDDVVITKPATVTGVSSTLANGAYPAGTVIPIQMTFNDTISVSGAPYLSLNTGRNATYISGSGTNTLTFNYAVQAGNTTSDLNYLSTAALSLNGGTLTDSLGNIANAALPAINAAASLGGNKNIIIDSTIPTGSVNVISGNPNANTVSLNLTAADSGSGLSQMRFSNDNATWTAWEAYNTNKIYTIPAVTIQKKIYVQWKDLAGNINSTYIVTINSPAVGSSSGVKSTDEDSILSNQYLTLTNLDGRTITPIMSSNPSKGKVVISIVSVGGVPTIAYSYTPNSNVNGTDSFSFKVSDGISYSNTVTVSLLINAVNDPPVVTASNLTLLEDAVISGRLTAVDVDSTLLTYSIVASALHGTVNLSATGAFTYTPNFNYSGTDTFKFKVVDEGALSSNTATVSIAIQAVNDAPVAEVKTYTILEDSGLLNGTVTGTDADPNSTLSYIQATNGNKGTVQLDSGGTFTYTPRLNENGVDTFTFRASDGILQSVPATVTVNITAVNNAPTFMKGLNQKVTSGSGVQLIPGWASDISAGPYNEANQTVQFTVTNNTYDALFQTLPAINSAGDLTFTPKADVAGTAIITIKLMDSGGTSNGGHNQSQVQSFEIKVEDVSLNIASIVVSPANWTQGEVTVTANVYTNFPIIEKSWAVGVKPMDYFINISNGTSTNNGNQMTDLSFEVTVNGTYTIFINNGQDQAIQQVIINHIDNDKPIILLRGDNELFIEAGSIYTDPGADVTDNSLPVAITVTASTYTNTNVLDDYPMQYNFTDMAGNHAVTVTRTVHVIDTTAPIITLLGSNPLTVNEHTNFNTLQLAASVADNSGETILANRTGDMPVSANPGTYTLTYTATDSSNRSATVTRVIYVLDNTAPTITISPYSNAWTKDAVTLSVTITDAGSTIAGKWAAGEQTQAFFTAENSNDWHLIENGSFTVAEPNYYTLFAKDSSGNPTLLVLDINYIDNESPIGSIAINNGKSVTELQQVTLQLVASDVGSGVEKVMISNNLNFLNANWQNFSNNSELTWNLESGDGTKKVYYKFKDRVGNESVPSMATILLDTLGRSNLSALISSYILNPLFNPLVTNYTINVGYTVVSVDMQPTLVDNQSTISVTGATYEAGMVNITNLVNGSNRVTIRVTSEEAAIYKEYVINIYKQSNMNEITGFTVNGQITPTVIDAVNHTVTTNVYTQTNLNGLIPQITISPGATISLSLNNTNDFRNAVHYDVTAEDNTLVQWTVHIHTIHNTSTDLSNLSINGFPFVFDPQNNSYSVDVGPLVAYIPVTAVPADLTASISMDNGTTYEQKTVTQMVYLAKGSNSIPIMVKDTNDLTQTYQLNVNRLSTYISSLSITGGVLSPSFNSSQINYIIHSSKTTSFVDMAIPNLSSNVKISIVGADFTNNGSVYHIDITNKADFTIQVTNLEGTVIQEQYHFSINPWLGFAVSHAQGTEVILSFKEALDLTTLASNHFTLANEHNSEVTIAAITYEALDTDHPIIHLKLNGVLTNQGTWLLIVNGVKNSAGASINVISLPVTSPVQILEIQQRLDTANDGVHIDDIIKHMNTLEDITGDNVFDSYDIQFILQQI